MHCKQLVASIVDSIKHCQKWLPLYSIDFEKEVISHLNNKRLLARSLIIKSLQSVIPILKHTNSSNKVLFSLIIFSQLLWPNFRRLLIMLMLGYTKWEDWSLTTTKRVLPFDEQVFSLSLYTVVTKSPELNVNCPITSVTVNVTDLVDHTLWPQCYFSLNSVH